MKCPYYQGVCGLDNSIICYTDSNSCNIYKDHEETLKEMSEGIYPVEEIKADWSKKNSKKRFCSNCKWCHEKHYEEKGDEPYIKRVCENKYGLNKNYAIYEHDFCSRWESKEN